MLTVNAYTGDSGHLSREELHSATLANSVSSDIPAITVLMHGLGGDAGDWSNNFTGAKGSSTAFAEDSNSIIENMRRTSKSGIKLYRAINDSSGLKIYSEYSNSALTKINDFSLHTVIVVQLYTWMDMEKVYKSFHNVIDKISYDYYIEKGVLPRINLIGHSMGGLINLQYAIEHPKNVASLVSLGTPYNGSSYDNPIVEMFGVTDFKQQQCISGTCGHDYYFCNQSTRKNTWNTVYSQNRHIKFLALSGETSLSLIEHIVWTNNYLEDYIGEGAAIGIRAVFGSMLTINIAAGFLPGDICVDTDSQKAKGYDGVVNYNKVFTSSNCNVNKRSQPHVPIPHNLETYDADMINCILKVIDYGNNTPYNSYTQHGIKTSIIAKSKGKWLIQLTNNTGSSRSFEYNRKMCFYGDAQKWSGLGHIANTDTLAPGASTILEIEEYGTATSIVISYDSGNTRYIFYANELDGTSCTMSSSGSTKAYYSYTQNSIKAGILSKYDGKWTVKLTNNTGSKREFYYNQKMCFQGDAKDWTGLSDIARTVTLSNGESTILEIEEYGTATSIVISYTSGSRRYIFYANSLSTTGTMQSYSSTIQYYSYTQNGMRVSILGKNASDWIIELTNNTGTNREFEYNQKMCFEGDAKNWNGLSHVATTLNIANGQSYFIVIQEYGTATSIAISYMDGNYRRVFYANKLNTDGTMTAYGNTIDTTQAPDECIAEGTLITLADGSKKAVEDLSGDEQLLVWNMKTGNFDSAPILFVDSEPIGHYEVINLTFSDGTTVKVVSEHGFWDVDLNRYVYLDKNASQYIGHRFNKRAENADGTYGWTEVQLIGVDISEEVTTVYSPVTYGHLCYYVNDMLSIPGGVAGLFDIFEVDDETMAIDEESFAEDIATYGTFTHEEFYEFYPISEEVFEAFNGKYLKVAIGKGLITYERICELIERYAEFF
ncbi:MAG: alpha/beta fold hydrolase [Clostridia bacterium]|nr:alpha/beta fold hydrolase [Clostridia bacterium]